MADLGEYDYYFPMDQISSFPLERSETGSSGVSISVFSSSISLKIDNLPVSGTYFFMKAVFSVSDARVLKRYSRTQRWGE